jgi:hypothetical protein
MLTPVAFAADIKYDAGGRRDPFVPLAAGTAEDGRSSGLSLEGIIYDPPMNSVVVIGAHPYKVGDEIQDGKIVEIRRDRVIVDIGNEKKTLWIRSDEQSPN